MKRFTKAHEQIKKMLMDDQFGFSWDDPTPEEKDIAGSNAPPEYTVSELAYNLKKYVEDGFSFVRLRGELSRVTVARSGHLYTSLKDDDAVMDAICWKGTLSKLDIKPEEGMEVVVTGRLTTYPQRSNYQLIIETMTLAGQGALLKMLEERRKKLEAEGLFAPERKKQIPTLPNRIGVITSPTGAVIRDILHRLNDRFPRPVYLWPAMVQGQNAATQVIAGIQGFNQLPENERPDLLIVARGGGSLEDLMPFNDEALVRAIAASDIPIISAVGHETDTTLCDYAADLRAPTPTGAAEMAVPVRRELWVQIQNQHHRMQAGLTRYITHCETKIESLGRGLGDPQRLFGNLQQRCDHIGDRLEQSLHHWLESKQSKLREYDAKLSPHMLIQKTQMAQQNLEQYQDRLSQSAKRSIETEQQKLQHLGAMMQSLSHENVLKRGFSLIRDENGTLISNAQQGDKDQKITIEFGDGKRQARFEDSPIKSD